MPIIPVIMHTRQTNPTLIASSSLINGKIKSMMRITAPMAASFAKLPAFFHGCNIVKQKKIIPVSNIAIIGKLSVVPIINDTEIKRVAIINRVNVFLRLWDSNSEMK